MREIKKISDASYSSLSTSIQWFIEKLPANKTIEAMSTLYEPDSNSSNKYHAIIILKDS